jgi:hypothetical protein
MAQSALMKDKKLIDSSQQRGDALFRAACVQFTLARRNARVSSDWA